LLIVFFLSGCLLSGKQDGGVYKAVDGGAIFKQKAVIDEKKSISRDDILDIEIDPDNENVVYIGTERSGLLRTTNGGDSWVEDVNNFNNVMSIKKIPRSQKIYIAAKKGARGKVFKTENSGDNWTEIYTEKIEGSSIGTIAFDYNNPEILYIGTSKGGILKTENGGETWEALLWAGSGIRTIVVDHINTSVVYFGTVKSGALVSKNAGRDFVKIKKSGQVFNIVTHPNKEGFVYLSNKEGLLESNNYGETWKVINTLVKPEEVASRGLAINPIKSNEIYYTSGRAFYKSIDSGKTWQPVQFDISRAIREIEIDVHNSNVIYLGTASSSSLSSFKLFPI